MSGLANITDNRTILQKADLALADLTGSGGMLVDAQAAKFIRLLIKQGKLMTMSAVTPMRAPKQLVEKIRFNSRVLRAGTEAQALPSGDRSKPNLSKVELDAKLFKAEVRLDNEVLEDSIEKLELRQTIMQILAEAIARDIEEVAIQGDTASGDTFLAQFDGVLKQATSNVVDATDTTLNKSILKDMIKALPSEYLRDKSMLRYLTSVDAEADFRDTYADRATPTGDKYLQDAAPVQYNGVPIVDLMMMPENIGTGSHCTSVLLTDPKNINFGIWRNIRLETDKLVSEGVLLIVATMRFDVKYIEETAVVKATNVKVV